MTTAPFAPKDVACPRYAYDAATRLGRDWFAFCATVVECFERDGKWFIETLADGTHPADEWVKVKVMNMGEQPGMRGHLYRYEVAKT